MKQKCDAKIATMRRAPPLIRWRGFLYASAKSSMQALAGSEFNDGMAKMFGISSRDESGRAKKRPASSAARYDRKVQTPSSEYEFKKSELAEKNGHTTCGIQTGSRGKLPFRLLRRTCSLACCDLSALDWMRVFCGTVRLYPSLLPHKKKASRERSGQSFQWHR